VKKLLITAAAAFAALALSLPGAAQDAPVPVAPVAPEIPADAVPLSGGCTSWLPQTPACGPPPYAQVFVNTDWGLYESGWARRTGVGWLPNGPCLGPDAQVVVRLISKADGSVIESQGSPFGSCGEWYDETDGFNTGATYAKIQLRIYRSDCWPVACSYRNINSFSLWW
jgi:hypothetical protein